MPDSVEIAAIDAGAARVAITPPLGVSLSGYPAPDRVAESVHDDLFATALVLGRGTDRVALVSLDLTALDAGTTRRTRAAIATCTGIPPERVLLWATHTHSAPALPVGPIFDEGVLNRPDHDYVEQLPARIAEAVSVAAASMEPALISLLTGHVEPPVGLNRRQADGPHDPRVPIVTVTHPDGHLMALLASHACHPTVLHAGSRAITADLVWGIREGVAARLGAGVYLLCATGAAGDQSTRRSRHDTTFAEAERLGDRVAAAIARAVATVEAGRPAPPASPRVANGVVRLPLRRLPDLATAQARLEEAGRALEQARAGDVDAAAARTAELKLTGARHTARYAAIAARTPYPAEVAVELQALAIGPVRLLALPVELFVELGPRIAERAPVPPLLICYANDLAGYVVTPSAAQEDGYEANVTLLAPAASAILIDAAVALLEGVEESGA